MTQGKFSYVQFNAIRSITSEKYTDGLNNVSFTDIKSKNHAVFPPAVAFDCTVSGQHERLALSQSMNENRLMTCFESTMQVSLATDSIYRAVCIYII